MGERRNWTREETLLAFRLYCYTPFGRLHQTNPDIIALAHRLGRTPGAVGMKACNFASLDPLHQERGVVGLANRSQIEEQIWAEFQVDSSSIAAEAEQASDSFATGQGTAEAPEIRWPSGPTQITRMVQTRRVQRFFRQSVLTSYGGKCALTGMGVTALLNASHIVPWSVSIERRADPSNGLCLNALHDRMFDRGLLTFDEDFRAVVSEALHDDELLGQMHHSINGVHGKPLLIPERFKPSAQAMSYHRDSVYKSR